MLGASFLDLVALSARTRGDAVEGMPWRVEETFIVTQRGSQGVTGGVDGLVIFVL